MPLREIDGEFHRQRTLRRSSVVSPSLHDDAMGFAKELKPSYALICPTGKSVQFCSMSFRATASLVEKSHA
jgi:hypothetical protein